MSGFTSETISAALFIDSSLPPKICIPIGRSVSKMSSFLVLLTASLIKPSEDINSVYIKSTPNFLHIFRKGGSLTSSIGANRIGNSPN